MQHLSTGVINELRVNARGVVRELGLLNDAYFDIGVTLAERHLLIELNSAPFHTVGEIADRLLLDKSTASRLIAKAVKKGYVSYASDKSDKRKRYLELTPSGKATLIAFEPIAFEQTRQALLTLSDEEVVIVYQGIALYAQGLRNARIHKSASISKMGKGEIASAARLLAAISGGGNTKEHSSWLKTCCEKGHALLIMKVGGRAAGCGGIAPLSAKEPKEARLELLGILPEYRELGLEKRLVGFCVEEARKLGYKQCTVDLSKESLIPRKVFSDLKFNKQKDGSHLWTLN